MQVGAPMPVAKAWERVREKVTATDLAEICSKCDWLELGYCAEGLERLGKD